ncbi:MAG: hypothetical protein H3C34_19025 [Caldilineaceae bacterium]|nr:hypothetical protein [Caldilineaceae bacterium]
MKTPLYHRLPPQTQRLWFAMTASLAILLTLLFGLIDAPLQTPSAPTGIVSLELAGDSATAGRILREWGAGGLLLAAFGLGLDYLYMVAYGLAIALGCRLVAQGSRSLWLARAGQILAWALVFAVAADAVENYALMRVLLGASEPLWPLLARVCALVKFTLVGAGLLYVAMGTIRWLLARLLKTQEI